MKRLPQNLKKVTKEKFIEEFQKEELEEELAVEETHKVVSWDDSSQKSKSEHKITRW